MGGTELPLREPPVEFRDPHRWCSFGWVFRPQALTLTPTPTLTLTLRSTLVPDGGECMRPLSRGLLIFAAAAVLVHRSVRVREAGVCRRRLLRAENPNALGIRPRRVESTHAAHEATFDGRARVPNLTHPSFEWMLRYVINRFDVPQRFGAEGWPQQANRFKLTPIEFLKETNYAHFAAVCLHLQIRDSVPR